ncbi:IS3 family transposase [Aminirod propionatiphilus]|uniref:IS3 family transposase n=1 Tax=Aminirod propionatiphilus TaxID=3415223 RepID=A0ACD1DUM4_9BACT|nr:IS3 family transposase [Synergistota bacterium]
MAAKRQRRSAEFKSKVAFAALKGDKTLAQLSGEFEVSAVQIGQWKKQLLQGGPEIFQRKGTPMDVETLMAPLYQEIGRLKMELDWLKKKSQALTLEGKRTSIDPEHPSISVRRQCDLLDLNRSSFYYASSSATETAENLEIMELIDGRYTCAPSYGSRRMTAWLRRQGQDVNRKRIGRLMRLMGLEGIGPKPGTSKPHPEHEIYPYLLRNAVIVRPNQVWSTDVTYLPMSGGFMYLAAVIDWHSRFVLSWELSNTLDAEFCVVALDRALRQGTPEIFNTDQGCQFTSKAFLSLLKEKEIRISMDGRGRALDNIFVERFWRTLKYEWLYLNDYERVRDLRCGLREYMDFYNGERLHSSLNYRTPREVHFADREGPMAV